MNETERKLVFQFFDRNFNDFSIYDFTHIIPVFEIQQSLIKFIVNNYQQPDKNIQKLISILNQYMSTLFYSDNIAQNIKKKAFSNKTFLNFDEINRITESNHEQKLIFSYLYYQFLMEYPIPNDLISYNKLTKSLYIYNPYIQKHTRFMSLVQLNNQIISIFINSKLPRYIQNNFFDKYKKYLTSTPC